MEMTENKKRGTNGFHKRLKSMLAVDFRRMFTMPLLYIMVGISAVIPILVLVMTTTMSATADPATGIGTEVAAFTNVWQAIASVSGEDTAAMSLTSMCNINLLYFLAAVLVCVFVAEDFKSGYSKNLFAVRSKKTDYVISKSLVGFVGGICMMLAYFLGTLLGGAIAGLSFDPGTAGAGGIVMCLLSKIFLLAIFVSIYILMGTVAKQKLWLSLVGSLAVAMLFYSIIPMMSPLDSGMMNVFMCLAGGTLFGVGIGAISNLILRKTNLV